MIKFLVLVWITLWLQEFLKDILSLYSSQMGGIVPWGKFALSKSFSNNYMQSTRSSRTLMSKLLFQEEISGPL